MKDFHSSPTIIELATWEAARLLREENTRREDDARRCQDAERQEREELIEWLKPFDYHSKHQSSSQLRQEGTCGWLLENATFQDWRSGSGSKFLWLYGIRTCSVCMRLPSSNCMMQPVAVKRHYCKNPLISQN